MSKITPTAQTQQAPQALDLHSVADAARILELSGARVRELCGKDRIAGARKIGPRNWVIVGDPIVLPPTCWGRPRKKTSTNANQTVSIKGNQHGHR